MSVRRGTYALFMSLDAGTELDVGALGKLHFPPGAYCYVGSAMGGLDQRISRHLSPEKRARWHVDRLTTAADSVEAYESFPEPVPECRLAEMALECGMEPFAEGFGCSDCRCRTHLFRVTGGSRDAFLSVTGMSRHAGRPSERHRPGGPGRRGRRQPASVRPSGTSVNMYNEDKQASPSKRYACCLMPIAKLFN